MPAPTRPECKTRGGGVRAAAGRHPPCPGLQVHNDDWTASLHLRAFSYEKALSGPVGQLLVAISGDDCHFMVSNREWQDTYNQKHHIKVPGLTAITLNNIRWQGTAIGDEACQGEDVHINGRIMHRVAEYSPSLITITVESLLITH